MNAIWDWLFHASIEDWELRLIYGAAIPQTLYVLGFGLRNDWWASLIGWGQFTKALAVALLLDLSILTDRFGLIPYARQIGLAVIALLFIGAWLQSSSWVVERHRQRQEERAARWRS